MITAKGYAVSSSNAPFHPFQFERKAPGEHEILIEILYCGICHSDLHKVKNEWGSSVYPMVPGHEIVGKVKQVGAKVKKWEIGEGVGVGCMINSCRTCHHCKQHLEQYCENGFIATYNHVYQETNTQTYGGYSDCIVVHEDFVLKIPENLNLSQAAPLLCAGITTYSPLKHWNVRPKQKIGVIGLGGLGHVAIKMIKAFQAYPILFTHSRHKINKASALGASEVVYTTNPDAFKLQANSLDLILNTASAAIDIAPYLQTLKLGGSFIYLGLPENDVSLQPHDLIIKRRSIGGSLIGGIRETQEMLEFCSANKVLPQVEMITLQDLNMAYERLQQGKVEYRFVIDLKASGL